MPEREFTLKPRRQPKPPQNQCEWLVGFDGVEVIMETEPHRIAYFAREASWGDIMREPTEEEFNDTLREISRGGVLGVAYKGGVGFRIRASRVTMDQMLRLAEGRGGTGSGAAAQTTRDSDLSDFNIVVPNEIEALRFAEPGGTSRQGDLVMGRDEARQRKDLYCAIQDHIDDARELYRALLDAGIPYQAARYVSIPIGFQQQWFHVMAPINIITLCETRLCGLVQPETNYLARVIRDLAVQRFPWLDKQMRSACEKAGHCVSSKNTMLFPPCGAFINDAQRDEAGMRRHGLDVSGMDIDDETRLVVRQYNPDIHLYPVEKNDTMQLMEWDIERQILERDNPGVIYSMSTPPEMIGVHP